MLLPDNGRAGSFVAERILGTSGSSPLLLILIARTPHTLSSRVSSGGQTRRSKSPEDVSCSQNPSQAQVGAWLGLWQRRSLCGTTACAVRLIAPVSRLFWIVPAGPFRIPIDDRRTLVFINCHGRSKHGMLLWRKLDFFALCLLEVRENCPSEQFQMNWNILWLFWLQINLLN